MIRGSRGREADEGEPSLIWAYPRDPSVLPGQTLTLHVSSDHPHFRVEFYRQGEALIRIEGIASEKLEAYDVPPGPTDQDWAWPGYDFAVPADWPSGAYVAMLVEIDAAGDEHAPDRSTPDGTSAKALFVVRNPRPGSSTSILYKISWATFHAYNATGYGSLYGEAVWSRGDHPTPGFKVTTRRPGGGTGGVVMLGDSPDYYDQSSRRQTFAHWDRPLIGWLEQNGYAVDFCTDLDLHRDPMLLAPYELLLSVGHDEYWSPEMRTAIDSHVRKGGNVAYLSGNIAGWRIHFTEGDTAFTCAKVGPSDWDTDRWQPDIWQASDPEPRTTGVSYYQAGGWWDGKRETLGYTAQHSEHWVYLETGIRDGDVFGADEDLPLVGYECDGADFRVRDGYAIVTGRQGTPRAFFILGLAKLGDGWSKSRSDAAATMGVFTSPGGGIVFQAATTDWPMAVTRNPTVAGITRNVLDRLRLPSVRILGPLPGFAGRMLAEEGRSSTFYVDAAGLNRDEVRFEWDVTGGAKRGAGDGPSIEVAIAAPAAPVTVSVTALDRTGPIAFGSQTFMPMTRVDALRSTIVNTLREMMTGGGPSASPALTTFSPEQLPGMIVTVTLPWLNARAKTLEEAATELLEIWQRDDTRPVIPDPGT